MAITQARILPAKQDNTAQMMQLMMQQKQYKDSQDRYNQEYQDSQAQYQASQDRYNQEYADRQAANKQAYEAAQAKAAQDSSKQTYNNLFKYKDSMGDNPDYQNALWNSGVGAGLFTNDETGRKNFELTYGKTDAQTTKEDATKFSQADTLHDNWIQDENLKLAKAAASKGSTDPYVDFSPSERIVVEGITDSLKPFFDPSKKWENKEIANMQAQVDQVNEIYKAHGIAPIDLNGKGQSDLAAFLHHKQGVTIGVDGEPTGVEQVKLNDSMKNNIFTAWASGGVPKDKLEDPSWSAIVAEFNAVKPENKAVVAQEKAEEKITQTSPPSELTSEDLELYNDFKNDSDTRERIKYADPKLYNQFMTKQAKEQQEAKVNQLRGQGYIR